MILNNKILNKLINSDYIKKIYPMIDRIDTRMFWDGDEELPFYDIELEVHLNDPDITTFNMHEKGFDPHNLINEHMMFILKMAGIDKNTSIIEQVYIKVLGPNGEKIFTY
jgi:hypothetical protein